MNNLDYNWQKAAAAAVADDYAVEKAFMDQAHAAIQNKAGPLMHDPHQIGFEIVHKNDAATRMVGIFGFRAGRQLFYAPVFFLNGEIKGTDLLYRHLTKTFVPLEEEWVVYLISNARSEIGKGMDKNESRQLPLRIDLDTLAYPPMGGGRGGYNSKSASDKEVEDGLKKEALAARWESFINEITEIPKLENPGLKDYVIKAGATATDKLASLMEESTSFADAMVTNFTPDVWMPEELIEKAAADAQTVKSAAEARVEVTTLSIRTGGEAHPALFKHGFVIDDARQKTNLNVVYAKAEDALSRANEPGCWDMLLPDGSSEEMVVLYECDCGRVGRSLDDNEECFPDDPASDFGHYNDPDNRRMVVVRLTGDKASDGAYARDMYGNQTLTQSGLFDSDKLTDELQTGKAYRAVDPQTCEASKPFVVQSQSDRDGVAEYRIRTSGWDERIIVINPDAPKNDINSGMFNSEMKFIPVGLKTFTHERSSSGTLMHDDHYSLEFHHKVPLGNEDAVDAWIRGHTPVKEACVSEDGVTGEWTVRCGEDTLRGLSKMAAAAALTKGLRLQADTAYEIFDAVKAAEDRSYQFLVWPKEAAQLQLRNREQFQTYMDPDHGITVDPAQSFQLDSMWNGPEPPQSHVGDGWDPTMGSGNTNDEGLGNEALLSLRPEEIAQMSQKGPAEGGSSAVFEHGVIGSLVHTFDANTLVKQYLPKLEDAVDSLGRTMFLFYWKPTDFEMAYGADDMSQLENQIGSSFKSLGQVLLELLKRSGKAPQVNVGADRN